jgi:hypothetical protein
MKRDREVMTRRLDEASTFDPVTRAQAVEQMASSSPPPATFAAALADHLCAVRPDATSQAFHELLLDHLVSLGPPGATQLLRVIFDSRAASVVEAALAREPVAVGSKPGDPFSARLKLALRGPGCERIFGILMHDAMGRAHRWEAPAWQAYVTRTPAMAHASTGLVWTAHGSSSKAFRRSPEGELLDPKDEPLVLEPSATVGVPHPAELSDETLASWSRVFAEYDLVAPFPQLERKVAHLPESWSGRDAVPVHRAVSRNAAVTHFVRHCWTLRQKGSRYFFDRRLRGDVMATMSWHASDGVAHLIELYFATWVGTPLLLGQVDPLAYAEALATLSELDAGH